MVTLIRLLYLEKALFQAYSPMWFWFVETIRINKTQLMEYIVLSRSFTLPRLNGWRLLHPNLVQSWFLLLLWQIHLLCNKHHFIETKMLALFKEVLPIYGNAYRAPFFHQNSNHSVCKSCMTEILPHCFYVHIPTEPAGRNFWRSYTSFPNKIASLNILPGTSFKYLEQS